MCGARQWNCSLNQRCDCGESIFAIPSREVVGVIFILGFGPYATMSKIVVIFVTIPNACVIIEIVFICVDFYFAVVIPQILEMVEVLPTHAYFEIKVHGIDGKQLDVGILVDE